MVAVLFRPYGLLKIYHLGHFTPVLVIKWLKIILISDCIKPLPNKKIQVFFDVKKIARFSTTENYFLIKNRSMLAGKTMCHVNIVMILVRQAILKN